MINWGLAPYLKDKLVEDVNRSKFLSVGLEESLNQITQTCQMVITVRFCDVNKVSVSYWNSSFMGHTTANDLLQHFTNITQHMNHSSIIHLSIDGTSVNHKFYRDLKEYREREKLPEMINFGVVIFIFCTEHLNLSLKVQIGKWKLSWNPAIKSCMIVLDAEMIISLLQNIN